MDKPKSEVMITVGELKSHFKGCPDDMPVYFSGLEFYRTKNRGDFIQVEFTETVSRDTKTGIVQIYTQIDWDHR